MCVSRLLDVYSIVLGGYDLCVSYNSSRHPFRREIFCEFNFSLTSSTHRGCETQRQERRGPISGAAPGIVGSASPPRGRARAGSPRMTYLYIL